MSGCSSCKRQTAKLDDNCPPIMSDGRLFTEWTPRCAQVYKHSVGKNSYESRQYMINNAVDIMKTNAGEAYLKASCGPCYENPDWNTGTMLPELNVQVCNARSCTFSPYNKSGLGLRREYWNPTMESEYQKRFIQEKERQQNYLKAKGDIQPYGHVPSYESV